MSDDDLIRRGDALEAIQLGETVTKMQARIAAIPAVDADPVCTCCGGTGVTYQTERRCACQPAALPARGVPEGWNMERLSRGNGFLFYTLRQDGWRKGEPIMVNDVTIRLEPAPGSETDLEPIAARILAALAAAVPDDLAEAGKVLEGVTQGPWVLGDHDADTINVNGQNGYVLLEIANVDPHSMPDARFIAWTREGVPALLARVAAQEAQIAKMDKAMDGTIDLLERAKADIDANKARAEAAETALAAMTKERDELRGGITEPHAPGDFVGDIYYGHPEYTTMGTHRWTGSEWVKLPSDSEALMTLLASARTALAAERAKVAKLVEAGKRVLDAPLDTMEEHNAVTDLRAAITEASQ